MKKKNKTIAPPGQSIAKKALALLLACVLLLSAAPAPVAKAEEGQKAKIVFTLDDGWWDNHEYALPVFQAYGFPATVYVNSDKVVKNDANFMSLEELRDLYEAGWDLANHTATHRELGLYNDEASLATLRQEYESCMNWLINNGFPRGAAHAAYPSGRYTKELISVLQGIGIKTGRNTVSGLQSTPIEYQDTYFNLPMKAVSSNYSLDSCKNAINAAITGGSTVIFMLHRVQPEKGDLTTTVSDLHDLLAFTKNLVDQGKAEVLTISQWYDEQIVNPLSQETPPAPVVTADDITNTVSGLTIIMEYSLDGGPYAAYRAATFSTVDLSGPHTLNMRYAASGINPAGPDTTLHFTTNRTVSFQSNGGSSVASVQTNDNATVAAPEAPTKEGHTFAGWYKDVALTSAWDFDTDTVAEDITLYAAWAAKSYAVLFKDWDGSTLKSQTVQYQNAATAPAAPSRTGYTFTGWDKAFGSVTDDLEVTAQYSINRYTITFDKNGGDTAPSPSAASADYLATVSLPAPPEKAGHTFAGWNTMPDGSGSAFTGHTAVTADATVFAQWSINSYIVTFRDWNADTLKTEPVQYLGSATAPDDPSREGYTFTGWDRVYDSITNDLVVTAQYSINRYTVTFFKNGGDTDPSPTTVTAEHNTTVALPAPPEKAGHTFAGWNTMPDGSGSAFTGHTAVTGDATVFAQWVINRYTVSFDKNGGETDPSPMTVNANYNTAVALPAPPKKTGHTFAGWNTKPDGTGSAFTEHTAVTGNVTVFARWVINSYTVTFHKNGGTTEAKPGTRTAPYNTAVVLPTPPAKTGSAFVGWNTKPDGSGTALTAATAVTGNITVYAQWLSTPAIRSPLAQTYNSLKLTWAAAKYAAGYEVWRSTASAGTYTLAATVKTTTYSNTSLVTNRPYYYKIRAYWQNGSAKVYAGFSGVVSGRPVPAAPASITASPASYNSVRIAWGAVAGASGYEVYRSTASGGTYTRLVTLTATKYTNTSLKTGTAYYYKVRAYRTVSGMKVYGAFTTVGRAQPVLGPTGSVKAARASYNGIKVTWGRVSGASGYEIWRASSPTGVFVPVRTTTYLSYTNTGLVTGQTYYYKVRAYRMVSGKKVYGPFSAQARAAATLAAPQSVRALRASATSIKVTWGSSQGTTRYELWRSETGATGAYSLVATTTSRYYTNTGLKVGKTYWYKVRCYRLVGSAKVYSPYSAIVSRKAQ